MKLEGIFDRLWSEYVAQNPSVAKISDLFKEQGERVVNDHIAFRTLDLPLIDIAVLAKPFIENGYEPKGEYFFKEKHLFARHFEIPGNPEAPRIFISQLILADCTPFVWHTMEELFKATDMKKFTADKLIFAGTVFSPLSYTTYKKLREDSEYAAWFYVFGFRTNHFTVSINSLTKYNSIIKVNNLLRDNGFILNSSGGEVKGTPAELLQQSSTMADIVKIKFTEGTFEVPSCYYEFAQRYRDKDGKLYSGFIAKSADKIFESTNFRKQ